MILLIVHDPHQRAFIAAIFSLCAGLISLLLGWIFYFPFIKNKFKHVYGTKRNNFFEYINDTFKILSYHRSLGLILIGVFFIVLSLVFFLLWIF